ncbi:MAG: hypothetical protein JO040_13990 [Gemmatimonadetes bacterium]|nr:hypothetical protein [Gemmatimonadota bacterium]
MRAEARCSRERPAWLLFYEASERQPDDPPQLVRHLGVDVRHAPLVLTYFATPAPYTLTTPDLEDERWAVRVWQGEKWIRRMTRHFFPRWIGDARPYLWAADDPNQPGGAPPESGNRNLTRFVQDGLFENGPPRRYEDLARLDDRLRERARAALTAYLCGMNRVVLPWGGHAATPRDLTDLLLQDVEVGTCQRASRIEEAVGAVQKFVQRARLGLEPGFAVTPAFALLWDRLFSSFRVWEACRRRQVYRENWIAWDELEKARRSEAFRFLESELRRAALTVPVPGGMEYWPGKRPPPHPGLTLLQAREPAGMRLLPPGPEPEGLDLMGTPERDARPSWLAPLSRRFDRYPTPGGGNNPDRPTHDPGNDPAGPVRAPVGGSERPVRERSRARKSSARNAPAQDRQEVVNPAGQAAVVAAPMPVPLERLPLWIQAAIRLGIRFVRVAAAGVPPGSAGFEPREAHVAGSCCVECGRVHPPVVDEYYFWLADARYFSAADEVQDADQGIAQEGDASAWHDPARLPALLAWESRPAVHLFWSRFHNGEFKQRRRSDEALHVAPAGPRPQLDFMGRTGDSLRFAVSAGMTPPGYTDPTAPGFRYDMATDGAVVLPLVVPPPAPATPFPGGLGSYPYFAYFEPGAPLLPLTVFSEATTVAGNLRAHCRFEAALKWYEVVHDPVRGNSTWAQCPPRRPSEPPGTGVPTNHLPLTNVPATDASGRTPTPATGVPVGEGEVLVRLPPVGGGRRRPDLPCCPSAPVGDEVARRRAVTLEYLETLLQWGDALMCRNTPEAFGQATVVFDTMRRILGPRPLTLLARDDDPPQTVATFVARPPSLNPRLLSLYDRAQDRLSLVHHCLNGRRLRSGTPGIDMPFFGDSPFRDGWRHTMEPCADEGDGCVSCCKPYRFLFLVQKAAEFAAEVRGFGAALLAAYEKGDAEYLASMRAMHERQLLELALEVRQNQWREADWQVQALQKAREGAQTRQRYYRTLLANGLNAGELGYEALTGVSMASRTAGTISEGIAQGIGMIPDMFMGVAGIAGTPLEFNQLPVGNKLAAAFVTAARILNALAEIASTGASLSATEGGWDRREAEWRHQVEVIGIEIEQIERQILAAERRRDIARRELDNHRTQIENATEVLDFLRDKFTSHELYLYLQQETAALHRQMYELAVETARQAQRAFNYERGYATQSFLPTDGWDGLHEALLAGDRLLVAVRGMEKAYYNENCREYELTKHLSLRLHFPEAFLRLQTTGRCEIEVPEWMFDLDYPGHYMRRIRNASVTIPAVVGPYTGVHCRLTLLSSTTRRDPRLVEPPVPCCDECRPADGYLPLPDDPRIVKSYAATEAIATSSGQNDSGLFELSFRDERYLPFEFAGAVSRWRIELPPENNLWPAETLSDFVLHLNYTAREGGDVLRRAANRAAQRHLPDSGVRLFNVRNEMPDAWQGFLARPGDPPGELRVRLGRSMFPFLPGSRGPLRVHRLELFLEARGATPSRSLEVDFFEWRGRGHHDAECERHTVTCVASSEWPHLYHGVLEIPLGPLDEQGISEVGWFRFPPHAAEVERAFLLFGYRVGGAPHCACR